MLRRIINAIAELLHAPHCISKPAKIYSYTIMPFTPSRTGIFCQASSGLKTVARKPVEKVDDETLILADVAEKAVNQVQEKDKFPENPEKAKDLAKTLTEGRWTHDYPITFEELTAMGLPVSVGLFREIYELMELYPQPPSRRPSVQYIPVPYKRENKLNENKELK